MRRPAVRFLLTLVCAASVLSFVPATSEAGIVPWAWDTLFGPVGSIQARRAARLGYGYGGTPYAAGAYYGPSPMAAGYGGQGYSAGCCNSGCGQSGCGTSGGCSCGTSCSSCGTGYSGSGYSGYDNGYVSMPFSSGGCANGQCNVNYPPSQNCTVDPNASGKPTPSPAPTPDTNGADDGFKPPITPGSPAAGSATQTEGFQPAGTNKAPAPTGGDPTKEENFVPPKVTPAPTPGTPPVEPSPAAAPKKSKLTEDDDKGTNIGPRLELEGKVTWRNAAPRTRSIQTPTRFTASANRMGLFAKTNWRVPTDTELAKK